MRNPFRFFVEVIQQPTWIPIWLLFMMIVNLSSVMFWGELLAKVIFVTFMLSAMLMMALYAKYGFEKILGMGHILWIPPLIYILIEIPSAVNTFKYYLIILSVTIAISLAFDIVDVCKYYIGRK